MSEGAERRNATLTPPQPQRSRDLRHHDLSGLLGEPLLVAGDAAVGVQAVQLDQRLVEAYVGDQRLQRAQGGRGGRAPVGQVGELPPPQGLTDPARPVVRQAVPQVGDDVGQVVGDPAGDRLATRHIRVEDLGVDVHRVEQGREALAQVVDVRLRAGVRLVPFVRHEVLVGAQTAAGEQQLGDLQEQEGHRAVRFVALGDLRHRDDETLDRVGDRYGEVVRVLCRVVQRGIRHREVSSLRRPAPA